MTWVITLEDEEMSLVIKCLLMSCFANQMAPQLTELTEVGMQALMNPKRDDADITKSFNECRNHPIAGLILDATDLARKAERKS